MLTLLLACSGPGGNGDNMVSPTDNAVDAALSIPPGDARLVRWLTVTADAPAVLSLLLEGGAGARRITFPDAAAEHAVPILGLRPSTTYDLTVELDGVAVEELSLTTEALDIEVPIIEVLVNDGPQQGLTLVSFESPGETQPALNRAAAIDSEGQVVWLLPASRKVRSLQLSDAGQVWYLEFGEVHVFEPTGEETASYSPKTAGFKGAYHHDLQLRPDGTFYTLSEHFPQVQNYPIDDSDLSITDNVVIEADVAAHIGTDGQVISSWSLVDVLDPTRIGYGSTIQHNGRFDWSHANALQAFPDEGLVLVGSRHQDAVVLFGDEDLEPIWILANHDGWSDDLRPYLLTPVGEPFGWPYHQHGARRAGNRVRMFDNGNHNRTTPYSQDPEVGRYSRVVEYEVDPVAMTVRQVWEATLGDPALFSSALGDADLLAPSGHVLSVFGFLEAEGGVQNSDLGFGVRSIRLAEFDPATDRVVWDVRMYDTAEDNNSGWQADAAQRVDHLYGDRATVIWL